MKKIKKYRLNINNKFTGIFRILFLALFSLGLMILVIGMQINPIMQVVNLSKSNFLIPTLNFIPIFIITTSLYYLSRNMNIATSLTYIFFTLLSASNTSKMFYRNDPFTIADFKQARETFIIAKKTNVKVDYSLFYILFGFFIFMNIVIYMINIPKPNKKLRLIVPISLSLVFILLVNTTYKSEEIWNSFAVEGNKYNISNHFNCKGVVYSFIHSIKSNSIKKPESFNKNEVKKLIKTYENVKNEKKVIKPHIVMIMGEAFSDISRNDFFTFNSKEDDPMKFFKELEKESILSGNIVVSTFGGGTSNTEFDVLTGNVSTLLNDTTMISFDTVKKPTPTIINILSEEGYKSSAIHPGYSWFYRRKNVYKLFKFQDSIFYEDFQNPELTGNLISEKATTEKILSEFKKSYKDMPLFEFCVTIQNHGPYTLDKYPNRELNYNFKGKKELPKEYKDTLAVYFNGISDMDLQIKTLSDYFKSLDEPVIFVYFGDHLPFLSPYKAILKYINYGTDDTLEDTQNLYKTPYIIWGNNEALKLIDKTKLESLKKLKNQNINASYLGATILELCNMETKSPFFKFISELRDEMPVVQRDFVSFEDNGEKKLLEPKDLDKNKKNLFEVYKNFIYYNMKYNN